MKEYHVTGNQRVKGNFQLYVTCEDSRGWFLWKHFDDLEECYSETFTVPHINDSKIIEVHKDGSKEQVYFYMD